MLEFYLAAMVVENKITKEQALLAYDKFKNTTVPTDVTGLITFLSSITDSIFHE